MLKLHLIQRAAMAVISICLSCTVLLGQDDDRDAKPDALQLEQLPGGTAKQLGQLDLEPYDLGDGPECEKGTLIVPENRQADSSRNIVLHFYRLKARQPSKRAPIFMVPGGPGGYFDDNWVEGLRDEPKGGSNRLAWIYLKDRDVVLVNQRGARLPDRRYQFFGFMSRSTPPDELFSQDAYLETYQQAAQRAVDHWTKMGLDLAGYDIMNMVEDLDELRQAMGYEKIVLRGTSFGSQWSFTYMRMHPDHVDRALLSGTEPIDYGYDSPQGIWNVFQRLEQRLQTAAAASDEIDAPKTPLTEAIKQIVERLEKEPLEIEAQHPARDLKRTLQLSVDDFRGQLRRGINARRESTASLENFPKFIYEVYNGDYRFLASQVLQDRLSFQGGSLQGLLIDNSLGISAARDTKLDSEPPRKWVGEPNFYYKATRDVTPTPVVPDSYRELTTDIPILLVHGDLDLSTPIENAEEALPTLSNVHLVRVIGGTHGAFDQAEQVPEFYPMLEKFLGADFEKTKVSDLGLPQELRLADLNFATIGGKSLFEIADIASE